MYELPSLPSSPVTTDNCMLYISQPTWAWCMSNDATVRLDSYSKSSCDFTASTRLWGCIVETSQIFQYKLPLHFGLKVVDKIGGPIIRRLRYMYSHERSQHSKHTSALSPHTASQPKAICTCMGIEYTTNLATVWLLVGM